MGRGGGGFRGGRGGGRGGFNQGPGRMGGPGGFDGGSFQDQTTFAVPADKCGLVIGKGITSSSHASRLASFVL